MTAWILAALLTNASVALPEDSPVSEDKGAPRISNFSGVEIGAGLWAFSGAVFDSDSDPSGYTVFFYGVLAGRTTTVQSGDYFYMTVDLGSANGAAGAQTRDAEGNKSNIAVTLLN